jgi:hypothetical protein
MSHQNAATAAYVSSDFDTFAGRPIQWPILQTVETCYKAIAPLDQNELEFVITADNE